MSTPQTAAGRALTNGHWSADDPKQGPFCVADGQDWPCALVAPVLAIEAEAIAAVRKRIERLRAGRPAWTAAIDAALSALTVGETGDPTPRDPDEAGPHEHRHGFIGTHQHGGWHDHAALAAASAPEKP